VSSSLRKMVCFVRSYLTAKCGHNRSRAGLLLRQEKLFRRLKNNVLTNSPFYRDYLSKDLEAFPLIDKSVFVANFNTINTQKLNDDKCFNVALEAEKNRDFSSKHRGYSVGLSSGTSGKRGMFVTSDDEQARWAGYIIGKMLPLRFKKQKIAFLLRSNNNLYESSQGKLINFKFFDLLKPLEAIISELDAFLPDILIAPAQILTVIANSDVRIKPQKIISVAEVLEKQDQQRIEQRFSVAVDQIYQCTEGFLASTCASGSLHMNEDVLIVEKDWVDKKTGRFSPIITDLQRVTQPVVRYRLDDILIENKTPCACGSSCLRIESIEGRHDDIVWYPSNTGDKLVAIFPDLLRRSMLLVQQHYLDYRIIQRSFDLNICLKRNASESKESVIRDAESAVEKELLTLFKTLEVITPNIVFDRWQGENFMEKLRRIRCEKKPELIALHQTSGKLSVAVNQPSANNQCEN